MLSKLFLTASLATAGVLAQQTAVSSAVFSNIQKFTNYAGLSYADSCPTIPNGATILQTFNFTTVDSKAVLLKESATNSIILSFRGSAFPVNLDQDFLFTLTPLNISGTSCSSCKVHAGFQNLYNTLFPTINAPLKAALASNPGSTLYVTGHSLGGALASLAGAQFAAQGLKPTVYTFGEPRNGDPNWSTYVNSLIPGSSYFRVTHYNDGVPQIPPQLLGFQHHGTEYWESLNSGNSASSTYQCPGVEPTSCNAGQSFGSNPINGAHISYTNQLIAAVLFNPACGYVESATTTSS